MAVVHTLPVAERLGDPTPLALRRPVTDTVSVCVPVRGGEGEPEAEGASVADGEPEASPLVLRVGVAEMLWVALPVKLGVRVPEALGEEVAEALAEVE